MTGQSRERGAVVTESSAWPCSDVKPILQSHGHVENSVAVVPKFNKAIALRTTRLRSQTSGSTVNMDAEWNPGLNKESICAEQSNLCGAMALRTGRTVVVHGGAVCH